MAIHFYYIALTLIFAVLGYYSAFFISFIFYWASASFFLISTAYLIKQPKIFRKNNDGRIPLYINILLWPFISGVYVYNAVARRLDKTDKMHKIDKGLYVATRLNTQDFTSANITNIHAIVDMTAEFSALDWGASALALDYLNVPTLDHQTPDLESLRESVTWINNHIKQGHNVVVHCALGRGRSVFVAAAYLLVKYPKLTVREVLEKITQVRTQAGLNPSQLKQLVKYRENDEIEIYPNAWLIVNPAAGGGKWKKNQDKVINQLYKHFLLTIKETTLELSAKQLTQQALSNNIKTVIAAGGDGTLREVAEQVVNKPINFGFLPMGTANALAHNLYGHLSKINPVELALSHLCSKQTIKIDTAICNEKTVLLLAGIGLEHDMINYADRGVKDDLGQFAYLSGFWKAYTQGKTHKLSVAFDNNSFEDIDTTSFIVANAAPFTSLLAQGNGTPNCQDGFLDVTWINTIENGSNKLMGLGELISAGLNINSSSNANRELTSVDQNIQTQRVKKVTIKSDELINYVIDGELFNSEELVININPNALTTFLKQ
ncbi:diacylglycerol kinase family protein [Pseudocolwellia agarivorans]|uniref:diacylglycerol kinase family protein n=1 Tax=Pseudocolwellia agarivorans TaxID=1911682 RepID=UPI000986343A|nr:diacylglycerol kinase family protein [Pseudocolwellia agarivorans]